MKAGRIKFADLCRAIVIVLLMTTLSDAACVNDSLAQINGQILVTASGAVYRITNTNGANVAFWLPPAGLTICDQVDFSGQSYFAVSNQDSNETVMAIRQR